MLSAMTLDISPAPLIVCGVEAIQKLNATHVAFNFWTY
jgi:hypothetical protein